MTDALRAETERLLGLAKAFEKCRCSVHDRWGWGTKGDAVGRCPHERQVEWAAMEMAEVIRAQAAEIERLKRDIDVADAFHKVAVCQRDAAWAELREARVKLTEQREG